jgi:molybdopterin converting factor subunit 1
MRTHRAVVVSGLSPPRASPSISLMTVTVLLFASYAEALGKSAVDVDVGAGATVSDVLARLRAMPGAHRLPPAPLVAVNEEYASRDRVLVQGDEVAVIPPVAGG